MPLSTVFYQFKAEFQAGKVSKAQKKTWFAGTKTANQTFAIGFKIKFIHKDIKDMLFLWQIT